MRQFRFVFLANSDVRLMERAADPAASFRFELGSEGTALVRDVVEDHQGVPCHKLLNLQVTCERPDLDDATMAHARAVAETILLLLSAIARAPTGDVEFFVAYEITPGAVDRALLQWLPAPELPEPRTPAPHELLDEVWMKLHAAAEREPSLTERIVLSMSWYRRALRETEVLFRFSNLWLALEALNPRLCDYFNIPSAQRGGLPGLRQLLDEVAGTGAFAQAVQARNDLLHVNRVRPDTIRALVEPIIRELDDAVVEGWGRLLEVAKDTRAAPSSSVWPYPNRYVLRATVRPDTEGWSENRHPWFDQIIALKLRQPARPGSITYDQSPTWTPHNVATAQLLSYEARGAETPNPPRSEGPGEIHVMRGKPTDDEQPSGHNEARDSTPGNAPSRANAGGGATLRAMSKLNAAERRFAAYLDEHGYRWSHEPDYRVELGLEERPDTTPDFLLARDNRLAVAEVRQFETTAMEDHLHASSRAGVLSPKQLFGPQRFAMWEKAKQLRPFANAGVPLLIVLANPLGRLVGLDEFHVTAAMWGNPSVVIPIDTTTGAAAEDEDAYTLLENYGVFASPAESAAGLENRHPHITAVVVVHERLHSADWREQKLAHVQASDRSMDAAVDAYLEAQREIDAAVARGEEPAGSYRWVSVYEVNGDTAQPVPDGWFDGPRDERYGFSDSGYGRLTPSPEEPDH